MAGSKSDYLENKVLDLFLGDVPAGYTRPAGLNTLQLALYTTSPGDATGGTEATGGGYARINITNNSTNFPAASAGSKSNGTEFSFTTFTGAVGTIVGWVLFDNSGNRLYWGDLAVADQKAYVANDQFVVPVGLLVISED